MAATTTSTANSGTTANAQAAAAVVPFTIGSRIGSRNSFTLPGIALAADSPTTPPNTPVQLPAVGYVDSYLVEVTAALTGTGWTLGQSGVFGLIDHIALRNSQGQNLIVPLTGDELYLMNKYSGLGRGLANPYGAQNDPKLDVTYTATGATLHFFFYVPAVIDKISAFGALPALASNRSYQFEVVLSSISKAFGGTAPTAVSVSLDASAVFWQEPVGVTNGGGTQQTEPFGLGSIALWQKEVQNTAQGENLLRSNNVGNTLRNIIFIARDNTGARSESAWSPISELLVDNYPLIRLKDSEWRSAMGSWFGYSGTLDGAGGLDTGVRVVPFYLLAGGYSGDMNASHAQYLQTLDATLLQLHQLQMGAAAAGGTLTILTQSVQSDNQAFIFSK